MIDPVHFIVPGHPVGAARPRVVRLRNGASHSYTPDKTIAYERRIGAAARDALGLRRQDDPLVDCLLSVTIAAYLPRPQRLCRRKDPPEAQWAGCKPDVDNIGKAVLDGLRDAITDDARVCELLVRKAYHAIGDGPRTEVWIEEVVP